MSANLLQLCLKMSRKGIPEVKKIYDISLSYCVGHSNQHHKIIMMMIKIGSIKST